MSELVGQCWLLRDLSGNEIEALLSHVEKASFERGDFIIERGRKNDSLWIVVSGEVGVVRPGTESSTRDIVKTLGRGDLFGEMSWLDGQSASTSLAALDACDVLRIRFKHFDKFLGANPDAHINVLRKFAINLSHRLRDGQSKPEQIKQSNGN